MSYKDIPGKKKWKQALNEGPQAIVPASLSINCNSNSCSLQAMSGAHLLRTLPFGFIKRPDFLRLRLQWAVREEQHEEALKWVSWTHTTLTKGLTQKAKAENKHKHCAAHLLSVRPVPLWLKSQGLIGECCGRNWHRRTQMSISLQTTCAVCLLLPSGIRKEEQKTRG